MILSWKYRSRVRILNSWNWYMITFRINNRSRVLSAHQALDLAVQGLGFGVYLLWHAVQVDFDLGASTDVACRRPLPC
jgi:hypothetical protein